MTTSRERVLQTLNHTKSDGIPVDFGATTVTGIHCKVVEGLRKYYGLKNRPVKIVDPFQMLGEIDEELKQIIGVDCEHVFGSRNVFDIEDIRFHEQTTPWGQKVLIAEGIDLKPDAQGDVYIYAGGDRTYPPSAVMPKGCFFVNAIERQGMVDDATLNVTDNLEEFGPVTEEELRYLHTQVEKASLTCRAVVASFGGTALGDIAFVPGMGLKDPKGIRNIAEWYMSTAMRQDYLHKLFEKQIDIAIENYKKLWHTIGDKVDVVFTCGTDFGTQDSQFCSPETFRSLWLPHYKRMNDWIHTHTTWKIFKHCCGAIIPILPGIIDAGFDIINPVQINAKDMDSSFLKAEFGKDLTFWGGGVDTQKILPYGTPEEIRKHVIEQCEIFGKDGGFVFNAIHNIQANVPVENVAAMIETLKELRDKN